MYKYGAWLKGDEQDELVFTGTMNDAYKYAAKATEKDASLLDRWRIGILPQRRVYLKNDETIIAAFETEQQAIMFTKDYLEKHVDLVPDQVYFYR